MDAFEGYLIDQLEKSKKNLELRQKDMPKLRLDKNWVKLLEAEHSFALYQIVLYQYRVLSKK